MGKTMIMRGTRVGAVASRDRTTVFLFGYGTYVGNEIPPNEGGQSFTCVLAAAGKVNPKIVLDNGDVVWGCECHWGRESEIRQMIDRDNLAVIDLTVADFRAGRYPHVMTQAPTEGFWTA